MFPSTLSFVFFGRKKVLDTENHMDRVVKENGVAGSNLTWQHFFFSFYPEQDIVIFHWDFVGSFYMF